MASSIVNNTVQGETSLPGQIFVFGGFALRANSLGQLEQIDSFAPAHQIRFGNLNYTADIRGDLIFDGLEPQPGAPHCCDGHDLALPPNSALVAAHESIEDEVFADICRFVQVSGPDVVARGEAVDLLQLAE